MTNMIMGPPIFAPLLFGTSAYLGLIASYLQREDARTRSAATRIPTTGWRDCFRRARARSHLRRAGHTRRQVSAPGSDCRRCERAAQRLRGLLLALQKQFSLQGAVESGHHRPLLAAAAFASVKEPPSGNDRVACAFRCGRSGRRRRFLLPRSRSPAPPRRPQAPALQHHVRTADLCSAALRRGRNARHSCQPAAQASSIVQSRTRGSGKKR